MGSCRRRVRATACYSEASRTRRRHGSGDRAPAPLPPPLGVRHSAPFPRWCPPAGTSGTAPSASPLGIRRSTPLPPLVATGQHKRGAVARGLTWGRGGAEGAGVLPSDPCLLRAREAPTHAVAARCAGDREAADQDAVARTLRRRPPIEGVWSEGRASPPRGGEEGAGALPSDPCLLRAREAATQMPWPARCAGDRPSKECGPRGGLPPLLPGGSGRVGPSRHATGPCARVAPAAR